MDPHAQERFVTRLVNEKVLERLEALELRTGIKKPEIKKPAVVETAKEQPK